MIQGIHMKNIYLLLLLLTLSSCSTTQYKAVGKKYMITTQGKYSTAAGEKIFSLGGNIIDVAAAISFVISVERPQSTGIGGGGFMLFYNKEMTSPIAIDFRERAPNAAHAKMYLDKDGNEIKGKSLTGIHAVGVPGLVAGILDVHKKYGKLSFSTILDPAIKLAESGFEIYPELDKALKYKKGDLELFPSSKKIFFKNGKVLKLGELLVQKDLAETLKLIAKNGHNGFYKGKVADAIISAGNQITQKDLDQYSVKYRKPIKGTYKDKTIYSMSPPSSGGIHVIQILNILEKDSLKGIGIHQAESVHLTAAAMQAAFADRAKYLGDSDFVKVPIAGLVSKKYAKEIRSKIKNKIALKKSNRTAGNPFPYESDETTHFTIMDSQGNTVTSTQTINGWFGSSLVAPGTGIVLNNEMDDFATKVGASNLFGAIGGEKNLVEPGKRPLSSMSPTIVFDKGEPMLALGTPSGTRILTCVAQTILNYLEYELPLFESVSALRFHHQWAPDYIRVEEPGFDKYTTAKLKQYGYDIVKKNLGCRIQAISRTNGVLTGVSDPRGEGSSSGI